MDQQHKHRPYVFSDGAPGGAGAAWAAVVCGGSGLLRRLGVSNARLSSVPSRRIAEGAGPRATIRRRLAKWTRYSGTQTNGPAGADPVARPAHRNETSD